MLVLPSDNNSPWTNYPRETEPVRWFGIRKQHSIMDWLFKRKPSEQCALENLLHFNNLLKRKANRNISSSAWGKGGGEIKWKFTCLSMPSSLSSLFHFENDDHNCKDNDNDNNNKINSNDNYNNYNNNYNEKVRVSLASTLQKIQPTNWSWIPYRNCIAAGHWGTQWAGRLAPIFPGGHWLVSAALHFLSTTAFGILCHLTSSSHRTHLERRQ